MSVVSYNDSSSTTWTTVLVVISTALCITESIRSETIPCTRVLGATSPCRPLVGIVPLRPPQTSANSDSRCNRRPTASPVSRWRISRTQIVKSMAVISLSVCSMNTSATSSLSLSLTTDYTSRIGRGRKVTISENRRKHPGPASKLPRNAFNS